MRLTVGKTNVSDKQYATQATLARAIERAGAETVEFSPKGDEVTVTWPEGKVAYAIAADGRIDPQLAWDMEGAK